MDFIGRRRLSVFGHIARLTQGTPAHNAQLSSQPSTRSFTWQGLETSSWSSSRALDRPTPQRHWICSCQPLGDRPSSGDIVERRWLRDDDDNDERWKAKLARVSSSSSSWRGAISRSIPPLRFVAKTICPLPAREHQSRVPADLMDPCSERSTSSTPPVG